MPWANHTFRIALLQLLCTLNDLLLNIWIAHLISAVWICTVFWVYRVWQMWWGMADWGGLGIWSVEGWMIGYRPVERWRWQGWDVRGGIERLGRNVWIRTWNCLVCGPSGQFSGMCGGTSYGQTSKPSLAWKKCCFQNKWFYCIVDTLLTHDWRTWTKHKLITEYILARSNGMLV